MGVVGIKVNAFLPEKPKRKQHLDTEQKLFRI